MSVTRNPFKLHVSILDHLEPSSSIMQTHLGYPVDNVIQIKLSSDSFRALFRDASLNIGTTSGRDVSQRYSAASLLQRLKGFFSRSGSLHNYNNLASDITTLIVNTYSDVDVNPVTLESACATDGSIFNYFFQSAAEWDSTSVASGTSTEHGEAHTGVPLKVYQMMARELDNMISRNIWSTSEDMMIPDNSYDDLDDLYALAEDNFWANSKEGDSIFIEGSFKVPTRLADKTYSSKGRDNASAAYEPVGEGNLPVIIQFVQSQTQTYSFTV
jgi:hypothetical protein